MKKVCILIGEGDSERYFFPKILEKNSFSSLSQKEGLVSIYSKNDVYWFFVYPPHFSTNISGKSRLKTPDTYRQAFSYLKNNLHLVQGNDFEIYLVVLFDTDGASIEDRKNIITKTILDSKVSFDKKIIAPVHFEIESWYFAGLSKSFPHFTNVDNNLDKLLQTDTSNSHTKETFLKYLDQDKFIGTKDMSITIAEYFDNEKAKEYSESFRDFHLFLEDNGIN